MQKKLIALAVAGVVAAPLAMAQSNVTIYGAMDAGLGSLKDVGTNTQSVTVVDQNLWTTSRVGFRGAEDLGNGLRALFQFESGVGVDAAAPLQTNRDTFIGVQGEFGLVRLGKYGTPLLAWNGAFDHTGNANWFRSSFATGAGGLGVTGSGTIRAAFDSRPNNLISYVSPNLNGLTLAVAYAPDEDRATNTDISGVGARYTSGPIDASYVYHRRQNVADIHWAGAAYDFGVVKAMAQYSRGKNIGTARVANTNTDAEKMWSVGLVAPVSEAGKVSFGYGSMKDRNGLVNGPDARSYALTYDHSLSARTNLYAGMRDTRVKIANAADQKGRNFGVGLRHTF